jgi:hypothetical protein
MRALPARCQLGVTVDSPGKPPRNERGRLGAAVATQGEQREDQPFRGDFSGMKWHQVSWTKVMHSCHVWLSQLSVLIDAHMSIRTARTTGWRMPYFFAVGKRMPRLPWMGTLVNS